MGEVIHVENLGFYDFGNNGPISARGETRIGGRIPVNPSPGLKSKGNPIGATGLGHIFELVSHELGEAGPRKGFGRPDCDRGERWQHPWNGRGGGLHNGARPLTICTGDSKSMPCAYEGLYPVLIFAFLRVCGKNSLLPGLEVLVLRNILPVNLPRELLYKRLRQRVFLLPNLPSASWNGKIHCKIPCWQGICVETGAISTASPARQSGA